MILNKIREIVLNGWSQEKAWHYQTHSDPVIKRLELNEAIDNEINDMSNVELIQMIEQALEENN